MKLWFIYCIWLMWLVGMDWNYFVFYYLVVMGRDRECVRDYWGGVCSCCSKLKLIVSDEEGRRGVGGSLFEVGVI